LTGRFFRATQGKKGVRFIRTPIGKTKLSQVGIEFASELGLQDPQCYTGHCWRRSCGTNASDAGVNVTTLMGLMGWSSPKTAMEYVSKSKNSCVSMSMYLTNVQRQSRPLILNESEFSKLSKTGHCLSSDCSLSRLSTIRSDSKSRFPVLPNRENHKKVSAQPFDPSVEHDQVLRDSALLIREVEEEEEVLAASQALIDDLGSEDTTVSVVFANSGQSDGEVVQPVDHSSHISNRSSMSSIGNSLSGMFPNLTNSGTMNINVYFGK
jgi:hypothetical protein